MEPTDEEVQQSVASLLGGEERRDPKPLGGPSLPGSGDDSVPLRAEDLEIILVWAIEKLRPFAWCYMGIDPNG
jgi:hypothetical protein